jgi:hypothetical protein
MQRRLSGKGESRPAFAVFSLLLHRVISLRTNTMSLPIASRARWAAVLALPLAAACADRSTGPEALQPPEVVRPLAAALSCRGDVRSGTVECAPGAGGSARSAGGARLQQHVLGGQGTYVRVGSSNATYGGGVFAFDVTVQNLLTLAMATADGATRHADGVRVLFQSGPTVTGGTGVITIANATGTGTFTAAGQPYFQYGGQIGGTDQGELGGDGILASGETSSARQWQLNVPATVTTFSFVLLVATETPPGAMETIAPQVTAISPATLVPGTTATLTGVNFHATPASNTVTIGGVAAAVTGGTATELQVTVPCVSSGSVPVQVAASGRTGSALAHPLQVTQRSLALGQAAIVATAAEVGCNEIPATGGAAKYVVSVYNTSTTPGSAAAFQLSADGAEAAAPVAADTRRSEARVPGMGAGLDGMMAAARARLADDRHLRMMETNRREGERLRAEFAGDPRMAPRRNVVVNADPPPATKTIRVFNANGNSCNSFYTVNATRVYYNGKIAIYEDDATPATLKAGANAAMQTYYNAIGDQFNADMEPIIRNNFGDPLLRDAVTDANGVLIALFTPVINNNFPGVAGFVVSCDQYPTSASNGASNFGEYFYAAQPSVAGTGYASNTPDYWYWTIRSTFIHETKHVASQAARVAAGATQEQSWLEEGTARHSEELWARNSIYNVAWKGNTGYGSNASPGSIYCDGRPGVPACTATNARRPSRNMIRHFEGLYTFMDEPESYSPFGQTPFGTSTFYAVSWSLVRYAIDRHGASDAAFLTALNGSTSTGTANLAARAGVSIAQLMGGWSLALYADDYPGLAGASPDIQMPTWNFDDIFAGMDADYSAFTSPYPLVPQALSFGSHPAISVPTVYGGGVKYFTFSGTHTSPQLIRLQGSGGGALPSTLRVAIARVE